MSGRIEDRIEIERLSADFAHHFDRNEIEPLMALFAQDAVYQNAERRLVGRAAIRSFFEARAASGRVSRHSYSGLRITFDRPDRAAGTSLWVAWSQNDPLPFRSGVPFAVADFSDRYARGADGVWRFEERVVAMVYMNAEIGPPRVAK